MITVVERLHLNECLQYGLHIMGGISYRTALLNRHFIFKEKQPQQ